MRNLIVLMILYTVGLGCKTPARTFKPEKSHVGTYSSVESVKKGFYAAQDFLGYATVPNAPHMLDSLPKLRVRLVNNSDSAVVVDFPFNWSSSFVGESTCFDFRNIVSPNHRVEYFFPDKVDTLYQFMHKSIPVIVPAREQWEMDVFICNRELFKIADGEVREFEGDPTGLWNFSIQFNYFYKFKRKSYALTSYRTEPVAIDIRK